MPGNESSTSGGGTGLAADDLSDFVIERDARILEVKERELILKQRIEVGEEESAEARRQLERRRQDEEDEFAEAQQKMYRQRRDENRQRQDEDRQRQDEFAEVQRKVDRRRQDEDRRRQDENVKLQKAARQRGLALEKERLALQESLLKVKKYEAKGVTKFDAIPKVIDEHKVVLSELVSANFLGTDTEFVSAKVDDKNTSSRSFISPSPASPSAAFPAILPVARQPSGRVWAATAPTFTSFDNFLRHSTTMAPFTPLQLVPLVPESMSTIPSQVSVSVKVKGVDPPGGPDNCPWSPSRSLGQVRVPKGVSLHLEVAK